MNSRSHLRNTRACTHTRSPTGEIKKKRYKSGRWWESCGAARGELGGVLVCVNKRGRRLTGGYKGASCRRRGSPWSQQQHPLLGESLSLSPSMGRCTLSLPRTRSLLHVALEESEETLAAAAYDGGDDDSLSLERSRRGERELSE